MKLWLDDIRPMPNGFDFWARSATQAIEIIRNGNVTDISFDHDLSDDNPNEATGYTVAKFIEKGAFEGWLPPMNWGVHSSNPKGRENIILAMLSAERFWFNHKWSFETRIKDEI